MAAKTRAQLAAQFTDQPYGSGGRKQIRQVDNGDLMDLLDSVPLATEAGGADFSAVAEDILPGADDTYDLGSAVKQWADGYFSGNLRVEESGSLVARVPAGRYQSPGNQGLLAMVPITLGVNTFDAIQFGDRTGPMNGGGDFIYDPDWNSILFLSGSTIRVYPFQAHYEDYGEGGGNDPTLLANSRLGADQLSLYSSDQVPLASLQNSGSGVYLELREMAEPAAPDANYGRLFVQDNGSGKTQLRMIFASGASQVIATEP